MRIQRTPRCSSPLGSTHRQVREVSRAILADLDMPHGSTPEIQEGLWSLLGLGDFPDLTPTAAEEAAAEAAAAAFSKDSDRSEADKEAMASSIGGWFAFERALNDATNKTLRWGRAGGSLRKGSWSLIKALGLDPAGIPEIPEPALRATRAKGVGRGSSGADPSSSAEVEALREELAKARAEAEEARQAAKAAEEAKAQAALAQAIAEAEEAKAALANALTPEGVLGILMDGGFPPDQAVEAFRLLRAR